MDGTYGFVYCGYIGVGMGVFRITNSVLVGVDLAGAKYRGKVLEDESAGGIKIAFEMSVSSGVMLVQGTTALDTPYTKTAEITDSPTTCCVVLDQRRWRNWDRGDILIGRLQPKDA